MTEQMTKLAVPYTNDLIRQVSLHVLLSCTSKNTPYIYKPSDRSLVTSELSLIKLYAQPLLKVLSLGKISITEKDPERSPTKILESGL